MVSNNNEIINRLYPDHLKLKLVQVIHRHGERTPVARRLEKFIPPVWNLCEAVQKFQSSVLLLNGKSTGLLITSPTEEPAKSPPNLQNFSYRRVFETTTESDRPVQEPPGACFYGQLTDKGRQTMVALGKNLRTLYIDKLKFLDPEIINDKAFYLRSSEIPRTIESLQQLFVGGLYPSSFSHHPITLNIHIRHHIDEDIFPNWGCPKLNLLMIEFKKRAELVYKEKLDKLSEKLKPFVKEVRIHSKPSSNGIFAQYHNIPIPAEFTPEVIRDLEQVTVGEWFDGWDTFFQKTKNSYKQNAEMRRLGIGRLLAEFRDQILAKVNRSPEAKDHKLSIYSGHDNSLGTLLVAMKAFDERWPPFGSNITFELFEDMSSKPNILWRFFNKNPTENHFVRMKYNDKEIELVECQQSGQHHKDDRSLCTLQAFLQILESQIPKNYKLECYGPNYGGYGGGNNSFSSDSGIYGGGGWVSPGANSFSPGGFSSGRQQTSGKDTRQSLRPVSIKQILSVEASNNDQIQLDGQDISNVGFTLLEILIISTFLPLRFPISHNCDIFLLLAPFIKITFVATIRSVTEQSAYVNYVMEDGTGSIEVRVWSNNEDPESETTPEFQANTYVRLFGSIKLFQNKPVITQFHIRPIEDFNEITTHFLEVVHSHLYHIKTPMVPSSGLFDTSHTPTRTKNQFSNIDSANAYEDTGNAGDDRFPSNLSNLHQDILTFLASSSKNYQYTPDLEGGISINDFTDLKLKYGQKTVVEAMEYLLQEGLVYTTSDEKHFKCTHDVYEIRHNLERTQNAYGGRSVSNV
ncbi:hypothetical protein G9A89_000883 [Geosiphon pyriformis]|nr:hypothetical protein G9A89_000883 [Geosiphon pyriformis]